MYTVGAKSLDCIHFVVCVSVNESNACLCHTVIQVLVVQLIYVEAYVLSRHSCGEQFYYVLTYVW